MIKFNHIKITILSLLLFLLCNCSIFKAKFDPVGHQYAVTLQKEALTLMAMAHQSYSLHTGDVYRLMTHVERAYEHSLLMYKNRGVTGLWDVMRSTRSNRLGRFMQEWEKEDVLDKEYIINAIKWVKEDFDMLIKIEEGKKK